MRHIASVRIFSHYISMTYPDRQKTQKDPSTSTIERTLSPPAPANCNFPAANARSFIRLSDFVMKESGSLSEEIRHERSLQHKPALSNSALPRSRSPPAHDTRNADGIFVSRSLDHLLGDKPRCNQIRSPCGSALRMRIQPCTPVIRDALPFPRQGTSRPTSLRKGLKLHGVDQRRSFTEGQKQKARLRANRRRVQPSPTGVAEMAPKVPRGEPNE